MKRKRVPKKILPVLMAVILLLAGGQGSRIGYAENTEKKAVTVLFTHDIHSHLDAFSTIYKKKETEIGGFPRIKTIFKTQLEKNPDTLIVDGGDFSMGTLYQTVFEQEAAELRMMGLLGYDAVTIGNHEFDYRTQGLSKMLHTAVASGDPLPQMVLCNGDYSKMNAGAKTVKQAFDEYGVKDYSIFMKNGVKIAVIGVFGKDALICSPTCELEFEDQVDAVKRTVKTIEKKEEADFILCLSHGGTSNDSKKSEDEILAEKVPELDLIVSGHSHTRLEQPIMVGNTAIVSCGEYGMNVGSVRLTEKKDGNFQVADYRLIPVTEEIQEDKGTKARVEEFGADVEQNYLAQYGYKRNQVLAENACTFSELGEMNEIQAEQPLGSLMADAYRQEAGKVAGMDAVDVAIVPGGTIRDTYRKGEITVSDVFNSFSLGVGEDKIPGYPLVSCYLTGEELKVAAEIDASISPLMPAASLYSSGLWYTFHPDRLILNKVTDVYLKNHRGKREEIENDKLYHVVADLYSGQMLSAVTDLSYGLLSVVPKDKNGNEINDLSTAIIKEDGQELKAWLAIARYMESFDKNAKGISEVPLTYNRTEGRKIVVDSDNLWERINRSNKYAAMIYGAVGVVLLILAGIVLLVIKRMRKIKL